MEQILSSLKDSVLTLHKKVFTDKEFCQNNIDYDVLSSLVKSVDYYPRVEKDASIIWQNEGANITKAAQAGRMDFKRSLFSSSQS